MMKKNIIIIQFLILLSSWYPLFSSKRQLEVPVGRAGVSVHRGLGSFAFALRGERGIPEPVLRVERYLGQLREALQQSRTHFVDQVLDRHAHEAVRGVVSTELTCSRM